jgi:hypothetical protein
VIRYLVNVNIGMTMSPELAFSVANYIAIAGWAILAGGVVLNNAMLRDVAAGRVIPLLLSLIYLALILIFWAGAAGGFGSLGDVAKLFSNPWLLLAGWVHYLAFDLFVGAWIARETARVQLPRLILVPLLPLTFLFGPAGYLAFEAARFVALRRRSPAAA